MFLVVNSASASSLEIANAYINLREIPAGNVFCFPFQGNKTAVSGAIFRDRILLPILDEIEQRGLAAQIDYVVYSSDFPWRIDFSKDFPDEDFPPQLSPRGSLTGLTYLYEFVRQQRKEVANLGTNFYYAEPLRGITVPRAFRNSYRWNPGGRRAGAQGLPYLISSMLGVTSGRGNKVAEVINCLELAKQADGTRPQGTVYFFKHNGPRSVPRHDFFEAAATELRRLGVEAKVIDGQFPSNKGGIAGLTTGVSRVDLAKLGNRFLPGAFVDNLTSSGGNLSKPKNMVNPQTGKPRRFQTSVADFIRFGATAACGTVIEPYSIRQKFPMPSFHVCYASGCSLGESFYQSVSGPYQQLLVGDPLCQPWAVFPQLTVAEVSTGAMLQGEVQISPQAEKQGTTIREFALFVDGKLSQTARPGEALRLDTAKHLDGFHELRIVARDDTPIETQGRWRAEVWFKNGTEAIDLSTSTPRVSSSVPTVPVNVRSTNGELVELFCRGSKVGEVEQGSDVVVVDTKVLGIGKVELIAVSSQVRSRPLSLEVTP